MSKWEENEEIQIFREYLRIPSVHPNIDYRPCVEFLQRQADEIGLMFRVEYPTDETKPLCIISYPGTNPNLKSIMLSSHMDVVPVDESCWTHKPFDAEIDEEGRIFARGAQDTKEIGTQYLAALKYFVKNKIQFKRTIHVTFTPEEEVGSIGGMKEFVHTDAFKNLNVDFALDEGGIVPREEFLLFLGERSSWRVEFNITGVPGHGSILLANTASEKLTKLLVKINDYRNSQSCQLNGPLDLLKTGTVTTVNVTQIVGGILDNVIPSEIKLTVDMRLAPDIDHDEFKSMMRKWCDESGEGIDINYLRDEPKFPVTPTNDSNKFWVAFKQATDEL
jgi:aminoacylase